MRNAPLDVCVADVSGLSGFSSGFLAPKATAEDPKAGAKPDPNAGVDEPEPNADVGAADEDPKNEGLGQFGSDCMGLVAGTPNPATEVLDPKVIGAGGNPASASTFLSSWSGIGSPFSGTVGRGFGDADGFGFGEEIAVAGLSVVLDVSLSSSDGPEEVGAVPFFLAAACIKSCISALRFFKSNILFFISSSFLPAFDAEES